MSLQAELEEVKTELSMLEHTLGVLKDAAMMDGVIDDDEQAAIDDLDNTIRAAKRERDQIAAELTAQAAKETSEDSASQSTDKASTSSEERVEEGGFFEDLKEFVGDAVSAIGASSEAEGEPTGGANSALTGSVGKGGENAKDDTFTVQKLLNRQGFQLSVDGVIGPKTIGAIEKFQQRVCPPATSKIAPGDASWVALKGSERDEAPQGESAPDVGEGEGGFFSDLIDTVEEAVSDVGDTVSELFDDWDEEALEAIAVEFLELEQEAERL